MLNRLNVHDDTSTFCNPLKLMIFLQQQTTASSLNFFVKLDFNKTGMYNPAMFLVTSSEQFEFFPFKNSMSLLSKTISFSN